MSRFFKKGSTKRSKGGYHHLDSGSTAQNPPSSNWDPHAEVAALPRESHAIIPASTVSRPLLTALPRCRTEFVPRPVQLHSFTAAEEHHEQLIAKYIHATYPRAPNTLPHQVPFVTKVQTGEF